MDLTGIISISGRPGLYKVVAQGKNNIIVESLIDGKKFPAYATDRISALDDISIYTYEEDVPLKEIYTNMYKKYDGGEAVSHKESLKSLEKELEEFLPDYDKERVYPSDIKKIFQWYNMLKKADLLKVEEEKPAKKAPAKKITEEAKEDKAPAKKTAAKKPAAKKPAAKKPAAKKTTKKADDSAKK